jgi:hypothetical protein
MKHKNFKSDREFVIYGNRRFCEELEDSLLTCTLKQLPILDIIHWETNENKYIITCQNYFDKNEVISILDENDVPMNQKIIVKSVITKNEKYTTIEAVEYPETTQQINFDNKKLRYYTNLLKV